MKLEGFRLFPLVDSGRYLLIYRPYPTRLVKIGADYLNIRKSCRDTRSRCGSRIALATVCSVYGFPNTRDIDNVRCMALREEAVRVARGVGGGLLAACVEEVDGGAEGRLRTRHNRSEKLDWMYVTPATWNKQNPHDLRDYLLGKKRVDMILTADENEKVCMTIYTQSSRR